MKADTPPTYDDSLAESFTSQRQLTLIENPVQRNTYSSQELVPHIETDINERRVSEDNLPTTDLVETPSNPLLAHSNSGYQSSAATSHASALPVEEARCSLLPTHSAIWLLSSFPSLRLSALSATVLLHANLISSKELLPYLYNSTKISNFEGRGPSDPISGVFAAANSTVGGIIMGVVDYPLEISRMVREDRPVAKSMAVNFALDSGKGVSRIVGTGLKAPMEFTLGLSQGFGNLPRGWGDESVREVERVTGVKSGLRQAGKGFGYGLIDGVTGIFTQPAQGAMKGGVLGGLKGFGKGIGGVVCKPAAGAIGLPAYTFKGIYEEIQKKRGFNVDEHVVAAMMSRGEEDWKMSTEEERNVILQRWEKAKEGENNSRVFKYQ